MKSFGDKVLAFYQSLEDIPAVPEGVGVLFPHRDPGAWKVMQEFYRQYYPDNNPRTFLIGINPGRLGAGITGIPFTDPVRLQEVCGIANQFDQKPELSSKFIYQVISSLGGADSFYHKYYITSVSPLGFVQSGKNLNYYDLKELQDTWETFMVEALQRQIKLGASRIAFSIGQGKNIKYLQYLNKQYQLFEEIIPLPHPRWVMQYRLKRLDEFIELYRSKLSEQ